MLKLIVGLMSLAAFSTPAAATPPAPEAHHNVILYGPQPTPSCGAWTQARGGRDDLVAAQYQMWLLGFISGLSWRGPAVRMPAPDSPALFLWVDQYCTSHPLDLLVAASVALSRELESRNR
jgi:hypothetical protein